MARKQELDKDARIKQEEARLKEVFKDLEDKTKRANDGLIYRAAFIRIQLEDYEKDINEKGYTEMFTQSAKVPPYERERPVARLYNSAFKNYQSLINQLINLLPNNKKNLDKNDELLEYHNFVNNR